MEINSSPGLEGIENATGLDIAGETLSALKKMPNPTKPRYVAKDKPRSPFKVGGVSVQPRSTGDHRSPNESVVEPHSDVSSDRGGTTAEEMGHDCLCVPLSTVMS